MKKSELVSLVLAIVESETEVLMSEILGKSRNSEAVDARHIVVFLLHKLGLYSSTIAEILSITQRYVQYIVTGFNDRISCNPALRNKYEIIANKLRNKLEITAF